MGSDQSLPLINTPSIKSLRDDDIPYTSYSISKPIDGDSPRQSPSPRLQKTKSLSKEPQSTPKHDIVVVADGKVDDRDKDPELIKLYSIPGFMPILRGSLNVPGSSTREPEVFDRLEHRGVLLLCMRYQEHLKQLAEAVAFDQNVLCIRIKEIDLAIQRLMTSMTERQKRYAKYAEQFQKVTETSTVLTRIKMNVDQILPLMERLNSVLPPEDQLEPFSMKPANKGS